MKITERIKRELARLLRRLGLGTAQTDTDAETPRNAPAQPEAPNPAPEPQTPAEDPPEAAQTASPQTAPAVEWRFGGFDGSRAEIDRAVKIGSVRISEDRIQYSWKAAPKTWERKVTEKGKLVIAAAFVWADGRWVGGKFDWTDETRNSRSTENNLTGYNGWDASAWRGAKRRGFCIASPDGRWRSEIEEG